MTINEFAKMCKCNTQTLRYYDKINLLKPRNVDPVTGYRQYDEEQALDFVKIKNLQMASFSLGEIRLLLTAEPSKVYDAFTEKINEQTALLQKLKKIRQSYQTEYMKKKEIIEKTKAKVVESMSNYNPQEEFGITDEKYRAISEKVVAYFDSIGLNGNVDDLDFCEYNESDESCETAEEYLLNPKDDPTYSCICQKHGWNNVKDFFQDVVKLDSGEYLFYFEANKEKSASISFCNIVLGLALDANVGKKMSLGCDLNCSKDDKNHFWLFKRNM